MFGWPVVCIILFVSLPVELAAISSLLGGYLLLPSGLSVDLPLVPPMDKTSVAAVSTLLLCWMKGSPTRPPRQSWLVYVLSFLFIIAPLFTSLGNSYELLTNKMSIPGFYPLDGVKMGLRNFILLAPFFVGSRYFSTQHARVLLLKSLAVAALLYSLPMLVEVRLSPQFHRWVYGYHPQSFVMTLRGGGFRPFVFLENGIVAALFVALALIAAMILFRARLRVWRFPAGAASAYLAALLIVCKSLGAFFYGVVVAPLVLFTTPRIWTRIALVVALFACAYPLLRWHSLVPTQQIAHIAESVSSDRSSSWQTRVKNEDQLLAKAEQKAMFGWGTWGRNRIYDTSGNDISLTDGAWIIQFGTWGWLGYLSMFGLFALAAYRAMRAVGRQDNVHTYAIGGLSLLLAVNIIDLLPNASLTPMTFLAAGAIARSARVRVKRKAGEPPKLTDLGEPALASQ